MNKHSNTLDKIILLARPQLLQLEPARLLERPSPDKWSKQEILGHLIDSAYNNHQRFLRATEKEDLIFQGYDQVNWVKRNNYQKREPTELVHSWATVNFHLARLIAGLPESLLLRPTNAHNFHAICMNRLPAEASTTLDYLIWDYIFHLEHHLIQLLPHYTRNYLSYSAPNGKL